MSKPNCWMTPDEIMKDAVHISIQARDAGDNEAANRGHGSMLTAQICARLDKLIEVLETSSLNLSGRWESDRT